MWAIFKVFIEFVTIMFKFFGPELYGILAPQPGIEPATLALEDEVLTTGPPGKSTFRFSKKKFGGPFQMSQILGAVLAVLLCLTDKWALAMRGQKGEKDQN